MSGFHRPPRRRQEGSLLLTALATLFVAGVAGTATGLAIVQRSSGCAEVYERIDQNLPLTEAEIERCRTAMPDQFRLAAAGASFVPTGADDILVTAPMSTLVELASRPRATSDATLPDDVNGALGILPDDPWIIMRVTNYQGAGHFSIIRRSRALHPPSLQALSCAGPTDDPAQWVREGTGEFATARLAAQSLCSRIERFYRPPLARHCERMTLDGQVAGYDAVIREVCE